MTNCNFVNNSAKQGGAIYNYKTTTADTCVFKTNSDSIYSNIIIYPPKLDVDNFTTFYGSNEKLTLKLKTNSNIPIGNANISIGVYFKDDNGWIGNYSCLSGEGWIPNLPVGSYYVIFNTEYAEFQPLKRTITILPIGYYINVTSLTTHNKTVNITAKSDIPNDILGNDELLFILSDGSSITATYGADGTLWAVHTFDGYGVYQINVSYGGVENVTVNNGTITINKVNSTIKLDNITLDYGETRNVTVSAVGSTGVNAKVDGVNLTVVNNFTIQISVLGAGNHTLTVTTVPDDDHDSVTVTSKLIINKVDSSLTVEDMVFDYGGEGFSDVSFEGASEIIVNVVGHPETVVSVNGKRISVSGLAVGNYTLNVATVPDDNHIAVVKTSSIIVNKVNSTISLSNITLDYGETRNVTVVSEGSIGISAKVDGVNLTVVNNFTIQISALGAGNHTLKVTTMTDNNHNSVTKEVKIIVNKLSTVIITDNETFDLKVKDMVTISANLTPAGIGYLTYSSSNESVVKVSDDGLITALGKGTATVNVSFAGNDNYAAVNKTIEVVVSLRDASVSAKDISMIVGDSVDVDFVVVPEFLNVTYVVDDSGVVTVDGGVVSAIKGGVAVVTLKVGGDGVYAVNSTTISVTVKKIGTSIEVAQEFLDLRVGENLSVSAILTPVGVGNLSFTSSDEGVVVVDDNGNVKAVGAGSTNVTVSFAGDDKYSAAVNKTIGVVVSLRDASVSAKDISMSVGDGVLVDFVVVPEFLNVTYVVDDSGVVTVDGGVVSGVKEGVAVVTLKVGGDGVYAENSTTITVTVNKRDVNVVVLMSENIAVGDNSTVNVVLPSDATGNVTFKVDGEVIDTSRVMDGCANLTILLLSAGNHSVEIVYSGDGKYNSVGQTKEIMVSKKDVDPEIIIPSDIEVCDNVVVDVRLPFDSSENVTLKLNGQVIGTVSVTNGTSSFKLPALSAGTHTVEITYSGDNKYNSASKTTIFIVAKDSTNVIAVDVTATYNVDKYLVITLKDSLGNPLANAKVSVVLNAAKNYATDVTGQVKIKISKLVPKTYTAKITFGGNDNYLGSYAKSKVVVKKVTPKITAFNKMFKTTAKIKKYAVTLKDNKGKVIKNSKVFLKLKGKTYSAKTNSKGKAIFKISKFYKKGIFKADIIYKGSKYYNKASKKVNIKVISVWKVISKGSNEKSTVKEIQRALKNKGYYLIGYGHYLKVDGIYWDCTVKSVKQFQHDKGLKLTGKVDEKTAKKLGII